MVLVSPRNPLNIGAVARAMANFGFARLTVVAPYEPHWREAQSAVGAEDLLHHARRTDTLAEAVAACTLVVGTGTRTFRKPEQLVMSLPDLTPKAQRELALGGRVAMVFGPEKHGLTREDLVLCHVMVEIPTDARQPSMNLGQAAAVCLYELASRALPVQQGREATDAAGTAMPGTPSAELERLAGVVEEAMAAAGYSPRVMQAANRNDLRVLLRRLGMNSADTRRVLGLFRRILWRLRAPLGTGRERD